MKKFFSFSIISLFALILSLSSLFSISSFDKLNDTEGRKIARNTLARLIFAGHAKKGLVKRIFNLDVEIKSFSP